MKIGVSLGEHPAGRRLARFCGAVPGLRRAWPGAGPRPCSYRPQADRPLTRRCGTLISHDGPGRAGIIAGLRNGLPPTFDHGGIERPTREPDCKTGMPRGCGVLLEERGGRTTSEWQAIKAAWGGMAVRIVVSETALESLLAYSGQEPEHSRLVTSALDALIEEGHDRQVLKLSGSPRPIWTHPLDKSKVIYFTYGHGADTLELRIVFVGSSPSDPESDLRHVLVTAGDVPYHEIPDKIWMNDRRTATAPPELPEMVLGKDASLDNYLTPSDDVLFEALDHEDKAADDLHGRRYRVLTGLRSAQELPIRLSPQQERLLGIPLPLLFQGVAGSGKTTIVAQFAHRQLLEAQIAPSVLIVTYTEELRQFTETILAGLRRARTHPITIYRGPDMARAMRRPRCLRSHGPVRLGSR